MLLIILISLIVFCVLAIVFILRKAYKLDKDIQKTREKFGEDNIY